jgi:hypothetical protein
LDDGAFVQVLQGGEEAWPNRQLTHGYSSGRINEITTGPNPLKFHSSHDLVEKRLEKLEQLRITFRNRFSPLQSNRIRLLI